MLSSCQNASQNEYLYFLPQVCVYLEGFINVLFLVTQNYSQSNYSVFSVNTDISQLLTAVN